MHLFLIANIVTTWKYHFTGSWFILVLLSKPPTNALQPLRALLSIQSCRKTEAKNRIKCAFYWKEQFLCQTFLANNPRKETGNVVVAGFSPNRRFVETNGTSMACLHGMVWHSGLKLVGRRIWECTGFGHSRRELYSICVAERF